MATEGPLSAVSMECNDYKTARLGSSSGFVGFEFVALDSMVSMIALKDDVHN